MKDYILKEVLDAIDMLEIKTTDELKARITITNPDTKLGDFATNAPLILGKVAKKNPKDLAQEIVAQIDKSKFESVEVAGAGFINFRLKNEELLGMLKQGSGDRVQQAGKEKILLEYFQPNIAKPLHIGHLRTAIIGDALKRMMKYLGMAVESDNHLGDWGTQFGVLILAYKKYGNDDEIVKDPIPELNKLYVRLNEEIEKEKDLYEQAKAEFVKLESGDEENRKIWKQFTQWSLGNFRKISSALQLEPFENEWPESFYEDRMPSILAELRKKKLLVESEGAQIVDLEDQKLGVAVIVKSDGGTTYLLRDLATYIFVKNQGFAKHLYVVDNRQSHHYKQLFAILKLMGEMPVSPAGGDEDAQHIDYGFISFKGEALSTRKGNTVLAEDVLEEAKKRAAAIIKEKNPNLKNKIHVTKAVSIGALKYYDLSHNRHSDFEFDWDEALDFERNSGPYLQYAHARLSGILSKVHLQGSHKFNDVSVTATERELIIKTISFNDIVAESLRGYLPNVLANYLYELSSLVNKFYHESPVMKEEDEKLKFFRLTLIKSVKETLGQGLNLLGIDALEEM